MDTLSFALPPALNVHAPDEGNVHQMENMSAQAQKGRRLRPQVEGRTT